jgi:hypothetical protein
MLAVALHPLERAHYQVETEEERPEGAHEEQVAEIWRQTPNPYLSHDVAIRGLSPFEWLALETCTTEKV